MKYLSLCSGIEAATVAWHPLGWEAVAYSEIERFPSQVLAHHYPQTPNLGDMTKFKEWSIESNVDLLVGGTPCQSFSVAGLRKGLDDPRGNLMLIYLAIAKQYRPNWLVWENVPGVLSSNGGRDFGSFLGGLAECGYGFAYRVLDAQYFGVAQRRRRVFVVGYLGDWRPAAAVLFERHSLSGHPAPSREKRKDIAGTIAARFEISRNNHEECVTSAKGFYESGFAQYQQANVGGTIKASGGVLGGGSETFLAQPIAYNITFCDANGTRADRPDGGLYVNETDVTSTLTKAGIGTNVAQPIAFSGQMSNPQTDVNMTQTLQAKNPMAVAWSMNLMSPGRKVREDHGVGALTQQCHCPTQGNEAVVIQQAMAVRRLTPKECERLQGFPDNYTDIQAKGKPTPDGPRYKALGNSMAVPVMAWIGQRIEQVEAICKQNK
jgi:DNA (cytosine-5)-methyltransferase 1